MIIHSKAHGQQGKYTGASNLVKTSLHKKQTSKYRENSV